jgi:hypothetical protein
MLQERTKRLNRAVEIQKTLHKIENPQNEGK